MDRNEFSQLLRERVLFLDGAYGTELFKRGFRGKLIETLNLQDPEKVGQLQREYIEAGADMLLTNTFSANRIKLAQYNLADAIEQINRKAVEIAKSVCKNGQIVLGDMSSTGVLLKPFGELDFDVAYDVFKEQASILIDSGVDGIIIETMSDLKELKAAVLAVRDVSKQIPIIACMTFEEDGKSVTGTSVEIFATLMNDLDVDVVGINCTLEPKQMISVFSRLAKFCRKPLCVEPNAGKPTLVENRLVYRTSPEEFAIYMRDFVELGANIIGGCCGTGPEHIKLMKSYVGERKPIHRNVDERQFLSSRTVLKPTDPFLLIGERINATGKKKLQEEIRQLNFSQIVKLAQEQEQEGCAVIDVNLGLEKVLNEEHFKKLIVELDKYASLPLSIDVQTLNFLQVCFKEYVGRPLLNSATCDEKHLLERIGLLKRYGGMLIVLCMEKEIPEDSEGRVRLAKKASEILKAEGIELERVFFDPLVLPIGAKKDHRVTVETIRKLKNLSLKSCIGLSNLSFGLPERENVNSAFLALCVEAGLNGAILNSKEATTMNVLKGALTLRGEQLVKLDQLEEEPLVSHILKGQREQLMNFVQEMLKTQDPLYISQNVLAKAMERVGQLYAIGKIYLPHLLLAAETVQPIFDRLNELMGDSEVKLGRVLLATVQDDIHDIGKKIVATVLRSGGFEVIDIGKNVPPAQVLEAVKNFKPDIVGLSAMMTTTVGFVKETADLLKQNGVEVFVMAGGASMNEQLAKQFGVYYARDALEALKLCKSLIGGEKS
ncbi:MAG: homocysteine S-methyltransferase family protein [Pseudothermotoga sp.]|nr:homocysteine S-methyltransferase family protein [Pseudothermotoga sp.]